MPASAPRADAVARRSIWLRILICLETALSFAMPLFFLILGTVLIPYAVGSTRANLGDPRSFGVYAELFLGWMGLIGLGRLLYNVWTQRALRRSITGLGLACGVGALLLAWYALQDDRADRSLMVAIVYLPLACTVHLVFLARRTLFG